MKKIRFFLCLILTCVLMAALTACGAKTLAKPTALRVDSDTLILYWRAVPDVSFYTLSINDETRDVRGNSYDLSSLAPGSYSIKVKACGNGEQSKDSAWSETIPFVREKEPGMAFKLINNDTEYEITAIGSAEGNVVIPEFYRGKPVTSIGDRSFAGHNKLTGVQLTDKITNIGAGAFYNCSYLTKINIPSSVKTIGAQAFQSCRLLNSEIVIPDSVTAIADNTFAYCRMLSKVTIGKGVKTIGNAAFTGCNMLKEFVIPDNVESIGESAFAYCTALKTLEIGDGVTEIIDSAFYECSSLETVKLGENLNSIGIYAFAKCAELTEIVLPDSLITIGDSAFSECKKLSSVTLGSGIEKIGAFVFDETDIYEKAQNLVYVGNWLVGSKDTEVITYLAKDFAQDLYGIAGRVFAGNSVLNQIELPDCVKVISDEAFYGLKGLISVLIGSGVKTVGNYAFYNCTKLQIVTLGRTIMENGVSTLNSSLEYIGNYAFANCTDFGTKNISFVMPDTVKEIGTSAFLKCGIYNNTSGVVYIGNWVVGFNDVTSEFTIELKEGTVGIANYAFYGSEIMLVNMPDSVKIVGKGAFYNCKSLRVVSLPDELERIADYTFYGCNSLLLDKLPTGLKYIGRSAFYKCYRLGMNEFASGVTLIIPDEVEYIGDYAFYSCSTITEPEDEESERTIEGIEYLEIGQSVKYIGNYAFANFVSLKGATMGDSVTYIGERAFYKCESLSSITLSQNIKAIADRTFYACSSLKEVTLPCETIGNYAFYKCSALIAVNLSDNLRSIGNYAFSGCSSLEMLVIPGSTKTIGKQAFRGCKALTGISMGDGLTYVDNHAFYGCTGLTIYTSLLSDNSNWGSRWNSTYRPVVWGVTLSADGNYVESFTKTASSITNLNELTVITAPKRQGLMFGGWALTKGGNAVYGANEIINVPDGTTLYATWF